MSEVSRQRQWQRKQESNGRCITCGKPACAQRAGKHLVSKWYCEEHLKQHRINARNRYRLKHGIPLDAPKWTRGKKE